MKIESLKRAEMFVAIALSLTVLFLLIVRASHAGALWRDECGALQLARMPTFHDVVQNFHYESFPLLFPAIIRGHTALFGTSDVSLRFFGFAVGVALVGIAWFNARIVSREVPLVFLALAGLNPTFLIWGTSIRGYGIGSVLIVLAFGLTSRIVRQPTVGLTTAAFIAFLAAVQCLFFNSALVFGIVMAAVIIFVVRGNLRWASALLGVGALCAIADIFYLSTYSTMDWNIILRLPPDFFRVWNRFALACGLPMKIMPLVWVVSFFATTAGAVWRLRTTWPNKQSTERDLLLFGSLAGVLSILAYYAFVRLVSYPMGSWHFLALICLLAAVFDLLVANLSRVHWIRVTRLAFVIISLFALPIAAWPEVIERQTNIDIVAQKLQQDAVADDLIIVNPFYLGVSFDRYYHGPARWLTIPPISEHRIHRDDLQKLEMMKDDPLGEMREAARQALQSHHRVWLVGGANPPADLDRPLSLLPAPQSEFGWNSGIYLESWSQQTAAFLLKHKTQGEVTMQRSARVNEFENVPLWMFEGWQD